MKRLTTVALHLGAHKTATSHLQQSISAARDEIGAAGVRFKGPNELRRAGHSIAEHFGLDGSAAVDVPKRLGKMLNGAHRLVLSEENFWGVLHIKGGQIPLPLYPNAIPRLAALVAALRPVPLDLFVAVRDPAAFVTGAYSQLLLAGYCPPVDQFRKANGFDLIDWADLVERIVTVTGAASVTVWRYEDYQDVLPQILALMLGIEAAHAVQPIARKVHASLSSRAVAEALAGASKTETMAEAGQRAAQARKAHPISSRNPKFDLWRGDERATSTAVYEAQLLRIENLPRVRMLRPM